MLRWRSARAWTAAQIDAGRFDNFALGLAASVWCRVSRSWSPKDVALPTAPVVAVAGSTWGGAGKTPVAIAIARLFVAEGLRVGFVSHGYGGRARRATRVLLGHCARDVGDEAVLCRHLLGTDAAVVVGRDRGSNLALAASGADVVVVDGLLQTLPVRVAASILMVPGVRTEPGVWNVVERPCPPRGDARAPLGALGKQVDAIASVGEGDVQRFAPCEPVSARPQFLFAQRTTVPGDLRAVRVGLVTNIARPARLLRALERLGIEPAVHVDLGDHGRLFPAAQAFVSRNAHRVDVWVAPGKTLAALGGPSNLEGKPLHPVDHVVDLSPDFREWLLSRLGPIWARPLR
jgi:tetraacyldisaccharide 4'-kinase